MMAAVLLALAVADPEPCREATLRYNEMVAAIHTAARDYERCLAASIGRDDCGAEFIELQVTHRGFETAVAQRQPTCAGQ